jgi:hypothetical protein
MSPVPPSPHRIVESVQTDVLFIDQQVKYRIVGPGSGVYVSYTLNDPIFWVMGMTAGDDFKALFSGESYCITPEFLAIEPIKWLNSFRQSGYVHWF